MTSRYLPIVSVLLLTGTTALAQTPFKLDFNQSADVSAYWATPAGPNQLDTIASEGSGTAISIDGGELMVARDQFVSNFAAFSRSTDIALTETFMFSFDLTVSGNTGAMDKTFLISLGNGFINDLNNPPSANRYARLGVNVSDVNGEFGIWAYTAGTAGVKTAFFTGKQTVRWVLNNSATTLTYLGPDGGTYTLASDKHDVWIGNTLAADEVDVAAPGLTGISDFKVLFYDDPGYTFRFDNLTFTNLPPVPPVFSQSFSGSADVDAYWSVGAGPGLFDSIATEGAGTTLSIDNGELVVARDQFVSSFAGFTRSTDVPMTDAFVFSFDLTVSGNTGAMDKTFLLSLGNGFINDLNNPPSANRYARLGVNVSDVNGEFGIWAYTAGTAGVKTAFFSGKQTVRWVLNNTGETVTYRGPDGSSNTVGNDKHDVWIGNTLAADEVDVAAPALTNLTDFKVLFYDDPGYTFRFDNFDITPLQVGTSVSDEKQAADGFVLGQNYPNPFNPVTVIPYRLDQAGQVTMTVYNLLGQTVTTLVNAIQPAGSYAPSFDATGLSSGIYLVRLQLGSAVQTRVMILNK
ncbi:MAG: T9SS type A sorting domain-containing protein [Bacteroidetes bacterium]|nr:T9SS type A sorting domain-containing protein [Bacteroidota bacterium]